MLLSPFYSPHSFFYPFLLTYPAFNILLWLLGCCFLIWWGIREGRKRETVLALRLIACALGILATVLIPPLCGFIALYTIFNCTGCGYYTHKASITVEDSTYRVASQWYAPDTGAEEEFSLYQCDFSGLWCHEVKKIGSFDAEALKYPHPSSVVSLAVSDESLLIQCTYDGYTAITASYPLQRASST